MQIRATLPKHGTFTTRLISEDSKDWPVCVIAENKPITTCDVNPSIVYAAPGIRANGTVEVWRDSKFHIYEVEWTPDDMTFYLDGVEYDRNLPKKKTGTSCPFTEPLNLGISVEHPRPINLCRTEAYIAHGCHWLSISCDRIITSKERQVWIIEFAGRAYFTINNVQFGLYFASIEEGELLASSVDSIDGLWMESHSGGTFKWLRCSAEG